MKLLRKQDAFAADALIKRVEEWNGGTLSRTEIGVDGERALREIVGTVGEYVQRLDARLGGTPPEARQLDEIAKEWLTLQTESEQRQIAEVLVEVPAVDSAHVRAVIAQKGEQIIALVREIESEIASAADSKARREAAEEKALRDFIASDPIAAKLINTFESAAAECSRLNDIRAKADFGLWGDTAFVLAIQKAVQQRFDSGKFKDVAAHSVIEVLARSNPKREAA